MFFVLSLPTWDVEGQRFIFTHIYILVYIYTYFRQYSAAAFFRAPFKPKTFDFHATGFIIVIIIIFEYGLLDTGDGFLMLP